MSWRLLPLVALVGCAPQPAAVVAPPAAVAPCDAAGLQELVGQTADEALFATALKRSGARSLRRLGPDSVMTMDYRTDRLNIVTGADHRVTRVSCG
ncbi:MULTISPECIES: I78 family peptidase inhibitor [unclassified Sphingomonas]|jgi:hypothetical protein|uniref:I78 family peptidase inhibitor n=1 Tax=unclassified Sphingomonas TaxID=196159 RepID=UPI002269C336|nr:MULTISPECIES: I78 family peptidase inhibitor [unclassified Sphingomonas]